MTGMQSHLSGITVKLQKRALDIVEAYEIGAVVKMPRIALRQQHSSNAEASSPYQHFLRNITIPFLDHNNKY